MSQNKTPSLVQGNIHNALLHSSTLVLGALLVAVGFAIGGLSAVKYTTLTDFSNLSVLAGAFIPGILIAAGFILAFSQQYLGFAIMSTLQEYTSIAVAGILYMIGQLLIGFGNNIVTLQPLAGGIVIIAGWVLVVISVVLSGNTGLAISKLSAPVAK